MKFIFFVLTMLLLASACTGPNFEDDDMPTTTLKCDTRINVYFKADRNVISFESVFVDESNGSFDIKGYHSCESEDLLIETFSSEVEADAFMRELIVNCYYVVEL